VGHLTLLFSRGLGKSIMASKTISRSASVAALFLSSLFTISASLAQYAPVYGGPAEFCGGVNDSGQAGAYGPTSAGSSMGERAYLFDAGGRVTELQGLGTAYSGSTEIAVYSINASGQGAGLAYKYGSNGTYKGWRPARWSISGQVTELGILGTDVSGYTAGSAQAIDGSGQTAGYLSKYTNGVDQGRRAVRWDSSGAATELAPVWTDANGYGYSLAYDINDRGQVCGHSAKDGSYQQNGYRAIRWEASGAATVLQDLGRDNKGRSNACARKINSSGQVAGYCQKYEAGADRGTRPVRWEASGAVTELGTLGVNLSGITSGDVYAINEKGETAGVCDHRLSGDYKGTRPVRWDAAGAITQLGLLGISPTSTTNGAANDINAAGLTVGWVERYDPAGVLMGRRAVYWELDGSVVDLNSLIDPLGDWTLTMANAISDTGWIAGEAKFDPDGSGPIVAYDRMFLMQVPEPGCLTLLGLGGLFMLRRQTPR
jgi:hypothetical protein